MLGFGDYDRLTGVLTDDFEAGGSDGTSRLDPFVELGSLGVRLRFELLGQDGRKLLIEAGGLSALTQTRVTDHELTPGFLSKLVAH